ncbi:MAG: hypothetical protein K2L45_12900 [Muribaculaceae bacterium]|nr:hypothetical protein [Muribaculaceae bacterium]MDE6632301.1 hypothetical protein [Muribaculaceae bacterium]
MDYALSIMNWIGRWRHTRGYGVHSPLAFRIVKECVRPDKKYGFYSDAYLDFEYHEDRKGLRYAKLALRLINLLRPKRVWIPGGDRRLCTALKMSFPKIQFATNKECPKNVDFIVCNSGEHQAMWKKMDGIEECGMLVFGKEPDKIEQATLMLISGTFTIILRREGMDFVSYSI